MQILITTRVMSQVIQHDSNLLLIFWISLDHDNFVSCITLKSAVSKVKLLESNIIKIVMCIMFALFSVGILGRLQNFKICDFVY